MLSKLLKHEFRATGRIMLPLLGGILALGVLFAVSSGIVIGGVNESLEKFLNILIGILSVLFFLGLFAAGITAMVLMIQRFYKNLLGDEGYLMFTLPASPAELIWSKLIVSAVWYLATFILVMGTMFVVIGGINQFETFDDLAAQLAPYLAEIGAGKIIAFALEALVSFILACFVGCLQCYLAMSIGQRFSSHKILLSVVFFFAITIVIDIVHSAMMVGLSLNDNIVNSMIQSVDQSASGFMSVANGTMLGSCIYMVVLGAIFYIPTVLLLKHKLNLE